MSLRTYTVFEIWRETVHHSLPSLKRLWPFVAVGVGLVVCLAFAVATSIRFQENPFPDLPGVTDRGQQAMLMAAAIPIAGTILLMGLLNLMTGPFGFVTLAYRTLGREISHRAVLQHLLRHLFPLLGSLILAFIINATVTVLGLFLMVVPGPVLGILFYIWYSFVTPVVILEGEGGGGALKRSRALTRDYFWKVSGSVTIPLVLEFLLVGQILMFASDMLYQTVGLGGWAAPAIGLTALLLALLESAKITACVLTYFDLRIRKDGFDEAMLIHELEGVGE